jgi:hypothetical protein
MAVIQVVGALIDEEIDFAAHNQPLHGADRPVFT